MTELQLSVLRALRIYGPCSNAEVGRRLGIAPDKTYRVIQELTRQGLIVHPKLPWYDLSEEGRRWFARIGPAVPATPRIRQMDLTAGDIDNLLERFDKTAPEIQRRTIAEMCVRSLMLQDFLVAWDSFPGRSCSSLEWNSWINRMEAVAAQFRTDGDAADS